MGDSNFDVIDADINASNTSSMVSLFENTHDEIIYIEVE